MSQNGEESTNSVTRPTASSNDSSELSEEQKRTVERCTNIVQEFRAGSITKPKAAWMLQRAIPHEDVDESQFLSTYEPYFDMLDNFDHYRSSNVDRTSEVQQQLSESHDNGPSSVGIPPGAADVVGPIKRPSSSQSNIGDGEYAKRTRLDYDSLPWNDTAEPEYGPPSLSQSVQETRALLENFSRDPKRARSSLLNCNWSIPQFPPSEWLNLLSGNAVDLDHVFSNIYTLSHNTSEVIELGKDVEILHGSSAPAKTVKTHGDWVIAWDNTVEATLFVFKHRRSELLSYGRHIQHYFAALPVQHHDRVINYDRAVRIRAAQRRDIDLSDTFEFGDLQIQWINNAPNPSLSHPAGPPSKEPKDSTGKGKKGRRSAACRRWNDNRCPNAAATCNYLHVCSNCSNPGHVASNCDSPGKK